MLACLLALATSGLLVAGGCRDTLDPFDRLTPGPGGRLVTVTDTLFADADTYIRQTQPNANWGTASALELGGGGKSRVLVRFDSTALRTAVGTGTLDSAWLEFTITAGPSGWGTNERTVDLHRLLKDWTELGATWNCAVDANTSNGVPDCPTQGWDMTNNGNGTYAASKTDRVKVSNGQTGVIRLDVTADVQGYLGGTLVHQGWVFRKTSEAQGGEAVIFSRESGSQPRLVLSLTTEDGPLPTLPTTVAWPASPLSVIDPSDTTTRYYRDLIGVAFDSTASATTFNALLAKYQATLIGGIGGGPPIEYYLLRFPDPGGSWAALDSLANAVRSEPGVVAILTFTSNRTIDLRGRFPNDVHIAPSRADWTGLGTARTWPWIAIRAPLAWGCEAGVYGGTVPKVAIADASFDALPADLVVSPASISKPSPADLTQPAIDPDHGVAVASLLGARGDNGTQMAGMMWQVDLELYASGTQQGQQDPMQFLRRVVSRAASQGVRVLGMSFGVGQITNATHIAEVRQALKYYLDSGADRLLIIATGQATQPGAPGIGASVQELSTTIDTRLKASDRVAAELMLNPAYHGKILFVAGTDQTGQKWIDSHVWTGVDSTIIAAPAKAVFSLTGAGSLVAWNGTSFGQPLVAGVAAQLWTMDPTLTAKEVVGYIIRGAQVPRLDANGVLVPPPNIGIAGVYQLDSYGSLSLLSKERSGTPICGIDVRFEYPANNPHVILERNPGAVDTIAMPASFWDIGSGGVAQGGRLFSITRSNAAGDPAVDEYALTNAQWNVRRSIDPLLARRYLERDTVDIAVGADSATLRGSQWGAAGTPIDMGALAIPGSPAPNVAWFQFGPDGIHALFATGPQPNCAQPIVLEQVWLVTLPAGPSYPVLGTGCNGTPQTTGLLGVDAAWDQTGTRFVVGERDATGPSSVGSNYYSMTVVNGQPVPSGPPVRVNGRSVTDYSFKQHLMAPTGATATWLEVGSAVPGDPTHGCYSVTRTTTSFAVVADRFIPYADPDWIALCQTPVQALSRRVRTVSVLRR